MSNWQHMPLTSGQALYYQLYIQTAYAIREKHRIKGTCIWPRTHKVWETGTVPSNVTETTFTDSSKAGIWTPGSCPDWLNVPCTTSYQGPRSWTVVFDHDDITKVVRADVTGITSTGQLTYTNVRDYVTAKQISAVSDLVGRTYYLIKQGGLWWSDRLLEWPNDYEWARGTVEALAEVDFTDGSIRHPASPAATKLRDRHQHWKTNEHAGRELLVFAADGFLKRITIISNTADVLTFATQTSLPAVGSKYIILSAGGRGNPNRSFCYPHVWYRGYQESFSSHLPTDETGTVEMPVAFQCVPGHLDGSDECGCRNELMFDNDFWTDYPVDDVDAGCGRPADECYTPDFYKTIRGLQVAIEELVPQFVEAKSYDGAGAVPNLNLAEAFRAIAKNSFSGTTGAVVGSSGDDGSENNQIAISGVTMPYTPIRVSYSVHRADGTYNTGRGVMLSNTLLSATSIHETGYTEAYTFKQRDHHDNGDGTFTDREYDSGKFIQISPTWTAFAPREFRHFYDVFGVWIPDLRPGEDGDPPTAIDPGEVDNWTPDPESPTSHDCNGVGTYRKRGKSLYYIDHRREVSDYSTPQGFADESGDAKDAVTDGDLARYVGTDYFGPAVTTGGNGYIHITGTPDPTAPYWDRFYAGQLAPAHQAERARQIRGRVSAGGTYYLRDKLKDWFDFQWFGGVLHTDSGTATGGSTTSLVDTTKMEPTPGSPSVEAACYWKTSKFVDYAGAYVGWTVEILISGTSFSDPLAIIEQRLITSGNNTTGTLSWAEPLSVSASGKQYRIREPYKPNRWKDHPLKLRSPSGTVYTTTITGNSSDTLFFTPVTGVTPGVGWQYAIGVPVVGGVYKRVSGQWQVATGADAIRIGVSTAKDFHSNPTQNLSGYVRRYGRLVFGDAITLDTFNEMYAILNLLYEDQTGFSYVNKTSATDPGFDNSVDATDFDGDPVEYDTASGIPDGFCVGGATYPVFTFSQAYAEELCQWDDTSGTMRSWHTFYDEGPFAEPTAEPSFFVDTFTEGSFVDGSTGGHVSGVWPITASATNNSGMASGMHNPCGYSCSTTWLVKAVIMDGDPDQKTSGPDILTFNGDGGFTFRHYKAVGGGGATNDDTRYLGTIIGHNLASPPPPSPPPNPDDFYVPGGGPSCSNYSGQTLVNPTIIRDFSAGMQWLDLAA